MSLSDLDQRPCPIPLANHFLVLPLIRRLLMLFMSKRYKRVGRFLNLFVHASSCFPSLYIVLHPSAVAVSYEAPVSFYVMPYSTNITVTVDLIIMKCQHLNSCVTSYCKRIHPLISLTV